MKLALPRSRRARITIIAALTVAIIAIALCATVRFAYSDRVRTVETLDRGVYGVVLGASIDPETTKPSQLLQDRLDTAIDLLRARKIQGVIVTGDDGSWKSNERKAMIDYLHEQKVPDEIIFIDDPAFRTFDSCKNLAAKGFNHVVLVTQKFHMARALYLCNKLGVESEGVIADKRFYSGFLYYWIRDLAASPFAFFDVRGVIIIKKGPSA